jgi:glycosyltransferase involved in cell wall biosynthesis
MTKHLKFSVITPSYNQGQFIKDNIKSVLDQNYPNFEHIIIDGGSTDNTINILKKYPHLIWKSEKDRGQTHAINKALKIASGDVIAWLNSDDMYCEDAFHTVNEFFVNNKDKYCLTGNLIHIDENGDFLAKKKAVKVTYDGLLNHGQCVQQMSTFFRKSVFEEVGFFDESYHYSMDHEMWVRISAKYDFFTIDKYIAKFRKYKETKTSTSSIEFVKEIIKLKRKHNGKIFTLYNVRLLLMFIKEPFKRIKWFRTFIRRLKGKKREYWYYR